MVCFNKWSNLQSCDKLTCVPQPTWHSIVCYQGQCTPLSVPQFTWHSIVCYQGQCTPLSVSHNSPDILLCVTRGDALLSLCPTIHLTFYCVLPGAMHSSFQTVMRGMKFISQAQAQLEKPPSPGISRYFQHIEFYTKRYYSLGVLYLY